MDIRSQADYQQALDQFTAWMVHEPADLAPMRAVRDAISAYEKGAGV
jgi:HTH-type transcriptional regulator/antitoxin HigA